MLMKEVLYGQSLHDTYKGNAPNEKRVPRARAQTRAGGKVLSQSVRVARIQYSPIINSTSIF